MITRCSLWLMETDCSCSILLRWFLKLRTWTMLLQQLCPDADRFMFQQRISVSSKCIKDGCSKGPSKRPMDQLSWLRIQSLFCLIKKSLICLWIFSASFSMSILYWKILKRKLRKKISYIFQAQLRSFKSWICLADTYSNISLKSHSRN